MYEKASFLARGSAKRVAVLGMLLALAVVLGWVEHAIPLTAAVPGLKLGLGNLVVVFALYRLGRWDALTLSAAKVALSALLFGGFSGMLYSAAGAAVSLGVMLALYRMHAVSPTGVSAAGGAAHIATQLTVAMALTATPQLWTLASPLLFAGIITGTLNGVIASMVICRLEPIGACSHGVA